MKLEWKRLDEHSHYAMHEGRVHLAVRIEADDTSKCLCQLVLPMTNSQTLLSMNSDSQNYEGALRIWLGTLVTTLYALFSLFEPVTEKPMLFYTSNAIFQEGMFGMVAQCARISDVIGVVEKAEEQSERVRESIQKLFEASGDDSNALE